MIASVPVTKIRVGERSRSLCEDAMVSLVESIKTIGLQAPISVQVDPSSRSERYVLVAGLHRLEACRRLGMAHIDARIIDLDEIERRLWEISENLHRAELTALERSEHIAEWIRLAAERRRLSAQVGPIESKRDDRRGHRHESGINAAARELKVQRTDAAKAASKEAQIRALREEAARKAAGRDDASASEARIEAAENAVRRLSQEELRVFADWFTAFRAEHDRADLNGR
jgi:ParB-like chromosome segregation protein Spo0J